MTFDEALQVCGCFSSRKDDATRVANKNAIPKDRVLAQNVFLNYFAGMVNSWPIFSFEASSPLFAARMRPTLLGPDAP